MKDIQLSGFKINYISVMDMFSIDSDSGYRINGKIYFVLCTVTINDNLVLI